MNFWHAILTFFIITGCVIAGFILKKVEKKQPRAAIEAAVHRNFDFFQY